MDSGRTLLQVEDNEDDIFALQYMLEKAKVLGFSLQVVKDGQQALDYLAGHGTFADRKAHPQPSLIFLDLKLPFFSGHEILEWIRNGSSLADVPVVILSGSDEARDREVALADGATEYLVKPASAQDLRRIMNAQGFECLEN